MTPPPLSFVNEAEESVFCLFLFSKEYVSQDRHARKRAHDDAKGVGLCLRMTQGGWIATLGYKLAMTVGREGDGRTPPIRCFYRFKFHIAKGIKLFF